MHYSSSEIKCLDRTVSLGIGELKTTLYIKPTDSQQYLDYTSHHRDTAKHGLFVGQVRHIRRICSDDGDYVHHLSNLKETLVERNYLHDALNKVCNEACKLDGKLTLARRAPIAQTNQPLAFIPKYSKCAPKHK